MFRGRDVGGNFGRGDFGIDRLIWAYSNLHTAYFGLFHTLCELISPYFKPYLGLFQLISNHSWAYFSLFQILCGLISPYFKPYLVLFQLMSLISELIRPNQKTITKKGSHGWSHKDGCATTRNVVF